MDKFEEWIAVCRISSGGDLEYHCTAAVWADSAKTLRPRLISHLENEQYHLVEIEECMTVLSYLRRYGHQEKVTQLSSNIRLDHYVQLGEIVQIEPDGEGQQEIQAATLQEVLLEAIKQSTPIFAVLDGAQFDDLPAALFDGDFVYRPLYHDTAIGDEAQNITSPQMVWLDEFGETLNARPQKEVTKKLLELIDDKPAAVFWQCPEGGEALYKHLRGINMIMIPKSAIEDDDDESREENEQSAPDEEDGTEQNQSTTEPDTHELVLFRHADANVMAQVLLALNKAEIVRILGPCDLVVFEADEEWTNQRKLLQAARVENLPDAPVGPLYISPETEMRIKGRREKVIIARISSYLEKCAPSYTNKIKNELLVQDIRRWRNEAVKFGVQTEAGVRKWAYLQLLSGGVLNQSVDVLKIFKHPDKTVSIDQRVDLLLRQAVPPTSGVS